MLGLHQSSRNAQVASRPTIRSSLHGVVLTIPISYPRVPPLSSSPTSSMDCIVHEVAEQIMDDTLFTSSSFDVLVKDHLNGFVRDYFGQKGFGGKFYIRLTAIGKDYDAVCVGGEMKPVVDILQVYYDDSGTTDDVSGYFEAAFIEGLIDEVQAHWEGNAIIQYVGHDKFPLKPKGSNLSSKRQSVSDLVSFFHKQAERTY